MAQQSHTLTALLMWKDEPIIKAITGDPDSGKTTLFAEFQKFLQSSDIPSDRIIAINFGTVKLLPNYHMLYNSIKDRLCPNETTYILLDEIQLVSGFEKMLASLLTKPNVDIYIAGSRAQLLGGPDATLLSGRYIEIRIEA